MAELFNITMPSDLSEWSSTSVGSGQSLVWGATVGLDSGPGMRLTLANTNATYAEKTHTALSAGSHTYYGFALYVGGLGSLSIANAATIRLATWNATTATKGKLEFKNNAGTAQIAAFLLNDAGSFVGTSYFDLGATQWVYVLITRSTDGATADGTAALYYDEVLKGTSSGAIHYNNFNADRLRVGAQVISATPTGTIDYGPVIARNDNTAITTPVTSSPPVNTVPTDSGQCFLLNTATAIYAGDEPTVAEGTSAITSVTLAATTGLAMTLDNTGTSVTFTNNGTSTVVLQNGASTAEYNTVLATISYTATTRGKKTITMTTSDGTLSDEDTWYVLPAVRGVSLTGTHAAIKACYESVNTSGFGMVLDTGETSGTMTVYAEDSGALSDTQVVTLMVSASPGDGALSLLASTRWITDVIM